VEKDRVEIEKVAEKSDSIKNIIVPGVLFGLPLTPQPEVSADPLLKTFSMELNGHKLWAFVAEKAFFDTVEIGLQELYAGFFNDFFRRAPLDWGHQDISVSGEELRNPQTFDIGKGLDLAFNFFPVVKDGEKQFVFFACLVSQNRPAYFLSRFSVNVDREAFAEAFFSLLSLESNGQKKQ
jgi:hypothetical protein